MSNILLSSYAEAQEAKLVKQAEWGSGHYGQMVEINGYYYIETRSNEIDVINPELTGQSALIGQIKFEPGTDMLSIAKFKNFLVVMTMNKIKIYSVSDVINITEVYSITADGENYEQGFYQGDYFYHVDSDSTIRIIEENENVFSLAHTIHSRGDDDGKRQYIHDRILLVEDSILYYLYNQTENGIRTAKMVSYQLDDFSLIRSGVLDGIGPVGASVNVGNGRFVISTRNAQSLHLIQLADGQVTILEDFGVDLNFFYVKLAAKNNIIQALSGKLLYTFEISDSNAVTRLSIEPLNSYFSSESNVYYLNWLDNKLIGISGSEGLFEVNFNDEATITSVTFAYNQSGYMGKAVIENNLVYLPRKTRIDVVDISNVSTPMFIDSIPLHVENINKVDGNFIFSSDKKISNQSLISDTEFQLNSDVAVRFVKGHMLHKNGSLYHLAHYNANDSYKLMQHNVSSPFTLYEPPKAIDFPDFYGTSCPRDFGIISNKLLVVDFCYEDEIHFFTGYGTADIAYEKTIDPEFTRRPIFGNEYIYFVDSQGIQVVELNDADELEEVASIDMAFTTTSSVYGKALGDYLFLYNDSYFYLIDIAIADSPRLISKVINSNSSWRKTNFQVEGGYVLVTTESEGQVKFFQLNKAPIANVVTLEINEDESSAPLILFTDPELDSLEISIITDAIHGDVAIDGEEIVYTPNENFSGEDAVLLKAEDIHGNFIEHEILVTVNAINDAPIILTSLLSTNEDTVLAAELTFQDVENDDVEFHLLTDPTNGLASISLQGILTYQPNDHFFGEDSLVVSITDENNGVSEKEIAITVASVNDKPELVGVSFNVDEDSLLSDQLTATDIDSEVLTFSVITAPESGTLNLQDSGHFTYQPNADYDQQVSFEVAVTDEQGAVSQAQFIIEVNSVNDAPVFEDNNFFTNEDTTLTQAILFSDVDSGVHTAEIISPATHGAVALNGGAEFTYIPDNNFSGIEQFSVRITDEHGASVEGVVKVTIAAVNDAPIFTTTAFSVDEDNILSSELKASDIEGQALMFELISNADLQGSVNVASNGQFTFEPVLNFNGETSFSVKVSDSGANFSTEIITIIVNAVEDAPEPENTALSLLFNGNVSQSLPTSDVDGQSLSYRIVSDVKNGLLTLSEAGQYTYSPNAGFSGVDSFTYEVSDVNDNLGQATVSFTVQSAVEPKKAESSSGGSFGYFLLFSLVISFGSRLKGGREYGF